MKRYPYRGDSSPTYKRYRSDDSGYNNRGRPQYDDDNNDDYKRRNSGGGEYSNRGYRGRGRGFGGGFNNGPSRSRGGGGDSGRNSHTYIPKSKYEDQFCYELAGYNLAIGVDDDTVSSHLFNIFQEFGKCKVGIEGEGKDRLAVISFKNVEDAKEARRVLQGTVVFDRKLFIKPYHVFREEQEIFGDSETRAFNKYNNRDAPPTDAPPTDNRNSRGGFSGKPDRTKQFTDHKPPEDDPKATRTLFVGNVDLEYSASRLKALFDKYGKVSDVDLKKHKDGYCSYAFIKFTDIQDAARAKEELNGYQMGKNVLKIGYGKGVMSHRIWVGGLGSWTKASELEKEFDRFGKITKLDYNEGEYHAYVMFESLDAASSALSGMKGYPLGGPDHRITVDFADPGSPEHSNSRRKYDSEPMRSDTECSEDGGKRKGSVSKSSPKKRSASKSKNQKVESLSELCNRYPIAWKGSIVLKTNAFSVKLYLVGGDPAVAEKLLVNSSIGSIIRVTQRLKLEKQKLDQLNQKLASAGVSGHCILVAMTSTQTSELPEDIQHRPLKHLLQYFIQKQAAGISTLEANDLQGVLHTFPPCDFSQSKLLKAAPSLNPEPSKEDYLVMILVKE